MSALSKADPAARWALPVLIFAAVLISFSGIFVKLSEVGPTTTGVYRMGLALPVFGIWMWSEPRRQRFQGSGETKIIPADRQALLWVVLAGVSLGIDLVAWHWCLHMTSVAAATMMGNTAPIWVTLIGFLFFRERFAAAFLIGMAVAMAGVWLLLTGDGKSLEIHDGVVFSLGMITAITYAGYLRGSKLARRSLTTSQVMFWGSLAATVLLIPVALLTEDQFLPTDLHGWAMVIGLSMLSQVLGQTLINWSLAHLPAAFSSVTLLINPVSSALFAWILLDENLAPLQILGGAIVLAGIWLAKPRNLALAE
jgi:drug/metabolite transporter (DMT)-like permease